MAKRRRNRRTQRRPYQRWEDPATGILHIRFRHDGKRKTISARTRDPVEFEEVAPRIYRDYVQGRHARQNGKRGTPFDEVAAKWLAEIVPPRVTKGDWDSCCDRLKRIWIPYFDNNLSKVTEVAIEEYFAARLLERSHGTVKKERQVLSRFTKWAAKRGYMDHVDIPQPPDSKGKPAIDRRRVRLSAYQAEAILAALPERTRNAGFPVKALFTLLWETGLRIEGVAKLRSPDHYRLGFNELWITDEVDKNDYSRILDLTPRVTAMLDQIVANKGNGLIFGSFQYFKALRGTAAQIADRIGLTPDDVRSLDARDFRHAATTDAAGKSNEIEGIAYTLGHKDLRTTSRYLDADRKSARRVLEARFGMGLWDGSTDVESEECSNYPKSWRTRRDSNPRLLPPEGETRSRLPRKKR